MINKKYFFYIFLVWYIAIIILFILGILLVSIMNLIFYSDAGFISTFVKPLISQWSNILMKAFLISFVFTILYIIKLLR